MEPQILTTKLKANVEEFEETITKRFSWGLLIFVKPWKHKKQTEDFLL